MQYKIEFPRAVREIENAWIPLPDGTRLAARIWMPENADQEPVPAILDYIPYRKSDLTAFTDSGRYPYLAGHGYACVRVDIRGSGDSEGILTDEYHPREQEDAVSVIAWLSEQPWCSGQVGMMGISWGGFNALQVAAHRPPALKAIITHCSTDDRYADDVHYLGGCVLSQDALPWATTLLGFNALPPNPRYLGDNWEALWMKRLENATHFIEPWLRNQRRNSYWEQGSVCENYSAIECPVYVIGGWADGYTNAVFRLLAGLSGPRKGLIGPWSHNWPHESRPGPVMGFLQECLRWWDYWLKGTESGIMDEPMLRAWIQESVKPASQYKMRPGRWISEPAWPPAGEHQIPQKLFLNDEGLQPKPGDSGEICIKSAITHGMDGGVWCPFGAKGELPADQQSEDERVLCFDTEPVTEPVEIFGHPKLDLTLSVDRPVAQIVARLCDVAEDGSSLAVTRGVLNLTHRENHQNPTPLVPGKWVRISLKLDATGHALPVGHRWRLAIGTSYWPMIWPTPELVTVRLKTGPEGQLILPVRVPRAQDEELPMFLPPECAAPIPMELLKPPSSNKEMSVKSGVVEISGSSGYGRMRFPQGHIIEGNSRDTYRVEEDEVKSASVHCQRDLSVDCEEASLSIAIESDMRSDESNFYVKSNLRAQKGGKNILDRNWEAKIPRDLV